MLSFKDKYNKEVVPAMREKYGYSSVYAVPRIKKVVINSGVGKMINARRGKDSSQGEEDAVSWLVGELSLIAGQRPQTVKARKSISGFKLREGMISGVRVTLRGGRMYDFLTRLVNVALPRMRDFRGFEEKSVDNSGNMTIGIPEQIIFPEIPHDKVTHMWGMEVTVVTDAKNREEGTELLKNLGIPFQK